MLEETMVTKYVEKGKSLGLWTDRDVSFWLAQGKRQRDLGNTSAPERAVAVEELWGAEGNPPFSIPDSNPCTLISHPGWRGYLIRGERWWSSKAQGLYGLVFT
jgi:hypothetical protein